MCISFLYCEVVCVTSVFASLEIGNVSPDVEVSVMGLNATISWEVSAISAILSGL